ncbi:MAG: hypothetical protein HY329_09790 [Chloroflexi bacterium]|nr:hypothetical protein [Chloroflexota bacterium]
MDDKPEWLILKYGVMSPNSELTKALGSTVPTGPAITGKRIRKGVLGHQYVDDVFSYRVQPAPETQRRR